MAIKELPSIRKRDHRLWTLNRLFICLVYGNRPCFLAGLKLIAEKRPNDLGRLFTCFGFLLWQLDTWLNAAVKETLYHAIEQFQLMCSGVITSELADVLKNYRHRFKHWHGKRYKNIMEAIDAIMPEHTLHQHQTEIEHFDRAECLEIFIDWDVNITKLIHNNQTAFSHAIVCRNSMAIRKLLRKGSFIGNQTEASDSNICSVDANLLENHFNSCVSKCIDDDQFFEFDLKNLIAPRKDCRICDGTCSDEIQSIHHLANSKNRKHLLVHPIISIFLFLKWNKLAPILYIDFIVYTIFAVSTIGYILAVAENMANPIKMTLSALTAILTIYIAARRISHQIFGRTYQTNHKIMNVLQCCHTASIVVCVVLLLFHVSENDIVPIKLATICIMLIALELFILAGSLFWSFSIYYTMFVNIAISSIKCFQLCIIFLPAFSLSFYLLLRHQKFFSQSFNNHGIDQSDYQVYRGSNAYDHIRSSIFKTLSMSSSELDAIASDFNSNILASYLFLGFQFFVLIVFMNLLIGLSVSDVTKIRSNATEASLIRRIALLAHYERVKSYKNHWIR